MDVLVLDTDGEVGGEACRRLEEAGHTVHRCHQPGAPSDTCVALQEGSTCPLDSEGVDATVVVRARPSLRTTPFEDGVSCSVRRHVPLVVAGSTVAHPFRPLATLTIEGTSGVVDACVEASSARLRRHEDVALAMLRATLAAHGVPTEGCAARVHRRNATVTVALHTGDIDARLRSIVATRVGAAVRAFDPHTPRLSIGVITA